jgi:anthranilate synthase/aminodeoxychorismate synthase-like glutamine amidotransferase
MSGPRVVILDNHDSFVFNLFQRFGEVAGVAATVVRNDAIDLPGLLALDPTHLVISPGPGTPEDAAWFGVCADAIRAFAPRVPVLGVCLGHQGIGAVFGARVVRAPRPTHGKASRVRHDGRGLFRGLPSPLPAMRYHSLVVDPATLPAGLEVSAWTDDGLIMGLRHRALRIEGLQFHPESIGTPDGPAMLAAFLAPDDAPARGAP